MVTPARRKGSFWISLVCVLFAIHFGVLIYAGYKHDAEFMRLRAIERGER